jgi:hypothetical protein
MAKYVPLTEYLRAAAKRSQTTVEVSFEELAILVGGLPATAFSTRQWWANSSLVQALAWREADYHVDQVYLDRGRVRFARGGRGASRPDAKVAEPTANTAHRQAHPVRVVVRPPIGDPVDARVVVQWTEGGVVQLDAAGKPFFGELDSSPGLYRMTFTGADLVRPTIYIGETDNLQRRLAGNYRSPGPSQATSVRVNALLRQHLADGGAVALAIATGADLWISGHPGCLDLGRQAARVLAENAALVTQQILDDADIANLG